MSFSPIDKLPLLPPTIPVERERPGVGSDAKLDESTAPSAPIDPHTVLAMDAWPSTGPRLFDSTVGETDSAAHPEGLDDVDQAAAHVVAFLT